MKQTIWVVLHWYITLKNSCNKFSEKERKNDHTAMSPLSQVEAGLHSTPCEDFAVNHCRIVLVRVFVLSTNALREGVEGMHSGALLTGALKLATADFSIRELKTN